MDGGGCRQRATQAGMSGLACSRVHAATLANVKRGEAVA
jgi:hypothetical protein